MKLYKALFEAFLIYLVVRLVGLTYRFRFEGLEKLEDVRKLHPKGAYLYAIWHQNIVASILSHMGKPHVCIVSASHDGEHVAVTLKLLGHVAARGSSSRGGMAAMKEMVRIVNDGIPGAISVDGPRGPAHVPKKGIFEVAKITGAPIVPLITLPEHFWTFKGSWDQFRLPKPFTKILVRIGEPMIIDQSIQASDWPRLTAELTAALEKGEIAAMRELQGN